MTGISPYLRAIRAHVGHDLVLLPSASAIIEDAEGRILLARHTDPAGLWAPPGGAVEPMESPARAVAREVLEETGLEVEPTALIGVYGGPEFSLTYASGDVVSYVLSLFRCQVVSGSAGADRREATELRYVDLPALERLELSPWTRALVPRLMRDELPSW